MRHGLLLAGVWLVASLAVVTGMAAGQETDDPVASDAHARQLARGEAVYAFNCTTCHGATGRGFAEARAAFPEDHYDCFRCHGRRNPPQMTPQEIAVRQTAFSLGEAPPLDDPQAFVRFGTAAGLYAYVRATMPRWDPGRLDDEAYLDVVAYVLHLAGILRESEVVTPATLDATPLGVPEGQRP